MIFIQNVFSNHRMFRLIRRYIFYMFVNSCFQLPLCLANIRSITVIAKNFINNIIINSKFIYVFMSFFKKPVNLFNIL